MAGVDAVDSVDIVEVAIANEASRKKLDKIYKRPHHLKSSSGNVVYKESSDWRFPGVEGRIQVAGAEVPPELIAVLLFPVVILVIIAVCLYSN